MWHLSFSGFCSLPSLLLTLTMIISTVRKESNNREIQFVKKKIIFIHSPGLGNDIDKAGATFPRHVSNNKVSNNGYQFINSERETSNYNKKNERFCTTKREQKK